MPVTRFIVRSMLLICTTGSLVLSGCSSTKPPATVTALVNEGYAKAERLFAKKDYTGASLALESLIFTSRATALEDDVLFLLGQTYYRSKEYLLAGDIYTRLLQQIPSTPYAKTAQFMLAKSYEQLSPHYELDQQYTVKAIEQFSVYLDLYPVTDSLKISNDVVTYRELLKINPDNPSYKESYARASAQYARVDTVRYAARTIQEFREKLARNSFSIARNYVQLGKYKAAEIFYDEIIRRYSDTGYIHNSWAGKIDMLMKRKKWFDAEQALDQYLQLYPAKEKEMAGEREKIIRNLKNS
ncbi:outer membrane protein assembly factor BamD [Chlorobium sp. KB01]|uniref:outer membrane protein assembly factor BamD n=1 Tax=Chlorobium sp. KB01 TaxID=1917528 RepID=UPI000978A300|nr:outer membrane protein assembly factor BamD [Chlorobium sp. KB01]